MSRATKLSRVFLSCFVVLVISSSAATLEAAQRFQRGDSNGDDRFDLSDAINALGFLFLGTPASLTCMDAADSNDDGNVDLSDAVHTLGYLFLGTPAPPMPFGDCGEDPTADNLGCEGFAPCPSPTGPPSPPVLETPVSPTREAAIELGGKAGAGLLVRVTGGRSPVPVQAFSGPDGRFAIKVELTANRLNRLYAVAEDAQRRSSAPAAVEVVQDSEAPFVYVDEPAEGSGVMTDRVTVTGRVSDMLSGYLGLTVTVNGEPAQVAIGIGTNGTFERQGVPLIVGANTIRVLAKDAVGNEAIHVVSITRNDPPPGDRLVIVSGNGQKAPIHATLLERIEVRALKGGGAALEGKLVTFQVTRSDGRLASRPDAVSEDRVMVLAARTGADGKAVAYWTLGSDAGCGNNRLKATGEGLAGEILFCASATPGPAAQINIGSGQNQRGEAGAPLAEALKAWVSDGCNGIAGVPVTFRVAQGTGKVDGLDEVKVPTGPTGHAQVSFLLGPEAGNQRVEAQFEGNPTGPAVFTAYALVRDETKPTAFSGLVLDNAQQPIGGAVVILEVPGYEGVQTTTDLQGSFRLEAPAAGAASIQVEGSSASHLGGETGHDVAKGSFPALTYEVVLIPNAENSLPGPILLPPLEPENAVDYDGTKDVDLKVKGVEGLEMRVAAGTKVTLRDGTQAAPGKPVRLSLNQVHHDDVPMPMPDGAAPPFAWTLQPARATFDPPLAVTYPNMSGLPAGAIAYFLTFNHDTGRFEIFASGHVVGDGSTIVTDRGAGIRVSGWGCNCPPYSVTANCKNCNVKVTGPDMACMDKSVTYNAKVSIKGRDGNPATGTLRWTVTGGGASPSSQGPVSVNDGQTISFQTTFSLPGAGATSPTDGGIKVEADLTCPQGKSDQHGVGVDVLGREVAIKYATYIPDNNIPCPFINVISCFCLKLLPQLIYFKGDDRMSSSDFAASSRAAQALTVIPDECRDPDGLKDGTFREKNDQTRSYASDAVADGVIDAADEDGVRNDCTLFQDSAFAGTSSFSHSIVRTGPHTVKVTLAGSPADPLIVGAPHIDWNLTITIDMTNPKAPMYSITGKHDDYPDHEIYINGVQVYFRHGTSILDLFGGGDVTVSAFGPIAP